MIRPESRLEITNLKFLDGIVSIIKSLDEVKADFLNRLTL